MLRAQYERVPSVETKTQNVNLLSERIDFLKKTLLQFRLDKERAMEELFTLQNKINSYNNSIIEINQELYVIKSNYKALIRDKNPVIKAKLIFRRHNIACPICNKILSSKKDLKVHKFKKHGY